LEKLHEDHESNEIAAGVIFLRIQENWPNALKWREVKERTVFPSVQSVPSVFGLGQDGRQV